MSAPNDKSAKKKERKPDLGPRPEGPTAWDLGPGPNSSYPSHCLFSRKSFFWYVCVTIVGQNGAGRHVVWCGISVRTFLDGSRGSIPSSENLFLKIGQGREFLENLENGRYSSARNGSPWLGTGSRRVEMNRTGSGKPLGHLLGIREAT